MRLNKPTCADGDSLTDRFVAVRQQSQDLCLPLANEDYGAQPMDDASPPKWHLAHTSWFFETFLLTPYLSGYRPFHPRYGYLFNSYYNGVGSPYPRARRGLLSRPTVAEVLDYRQHVNEGIVALLAGMSPGQQPEILQRLELGVHHEQQHQELLLTDIKYNLGSNPLLPAYRTDLTVGEPSADAVPALTFSEFDGGIASVGAGGDQFCFDNELPEHKTLLLPYALGDRLVTSGEFREFMADGGYRNPDLWLSDGWAWLQTLRRAAAAPSFGDEVGTLADGGPLYWFCRGEEYLEYRLSGLQVLEAAAPVTHVSFYEADAYARWAGRRLPREHEWENAALTHAIGGNFVGNERLHPAPAGPGPLAQIYGDVWEWTASPYGAYPGYRPLPGTLGEYNGKFMSNQLVLRGGSCATPVDHIRPTYRNFFYPGDRWQFSGIRLASDR